MNLGSRNISTFSIHHKPLLSFTLLFILSIPITLEAQRNAPVDRFATGLIVGVNTSQINGDFLSGFEKPGGFIGLRAIARITNSTELIIEMQYNRKGSRDPNRFVPGLGGNRSITLDYIEIPFLLNKTIETKSIKYSVESGIAYARLFSLKINENPGTVNYNTFTEIQDDFNNQEIIFLFGGGVMLSKHIRLMVRSAYSLTLLYERETPVINISGELPVYNTLRNIQLSLGVNYIF